MTLKKKISIITPTFNEKDNIDDLIKRLQSVIAELPAYDFEILIIDNCSTDGTKEKLRQIAAENSKIKVIFNTRNFGHIRSPYYGILQTTGDATIYLASDLQDPPEMIHDFIKEWESGYKLVMAVKPTSEGNRLVHGLRRIYYKFLDSISDVSIIKDSTGFGLYDKSVIEHLKQINDPYPFLRGLICELGFKVKTIMFDQPRRVRGISKNNIYTLYDIAMLGIVSHSMLPIRIGGFIGLIIGCTSIFSAFVFLILKILNWQAYPMGSAPIIIGLFFLFGFLLCFMALIGEYIGSIHTYVQRRPIAVEAERLNFEAHDDH